MRQIVALVVAGVVGAALLAGCQFGVSSSPSAAPAKLTVGLGFMPHIQFAQFYRALQQGYYRDGGLDVSLQYGNDAQLVPQIGQGAVDIGLSDGTSVIPAVSSGIPVRYGATIYARFPSVVIARAESGIATAADLRGKRVGIPGRYGSSWIMLQALLASAGMSPIDVDIRLYPDFSQAVALREGQVDAATGFANNEPVQLALAGIKTNVMAVDDITPLPGPGLTVGEATAASRREAIRAFVDETLRAMREIIDNPELGVEDAAKEVPALATDRPTQLAILQATVAMWQSPYTDTHGIGAIDHDAWTRSIDFMQTLPDLDIKADLSADQLLTEDLLQ